MTAKELIASMCRCGPDLMARLRRFLEERSQRQRFWIILAMLAAFAAADAGVIVWSCYRFRCEHIQPFNP